MASEIVDELRYMSENYELRDDRERLLLRLAELLEQSSVLAHLAQEPLGHAEPIFVLRGRDLIAGMTVRHWAALASQHGVITKGGQPTRLVEKIRTAHEIAQAMEDWHPRQLPGS